MDKILFFPFFFSKWVHICRNDRFYCCSCRLNSTGINGWVCSGICNNEIIQDGNYIITKKNSNFYITITSEMTPKSLIYASGSTELTLNETFDTLSFGVSIGSANLLSVYKRIKM